MLVDTHAHLDFRDFDTDRDVVVTRAREADVTAVINPGCDLATSRKAVDLAVEYEGFIHAAVGVHPNETAKARPGDMLTISRLAEHPAVVAVGEIGLDYYRDRSPRDVQARAFAGQLVLARELDKPVIIHFREVEREGVDIVGEDLLRSVRGVFHCFGGSAEFAGELVDWGFHIGFDGPVTYPKSDRVDVARTVPLERILIETDAPFLTPQVHRGTRNEPAYVRYVAETIAEVKGVAVDEVIAVTGDNARRLFGIG